MAYISYHKYRGLGGRNRFVNLFHRDGVIYFAVITRMCLPFGSQRRFTSIEAHGHANITALATGNVIVLVTADKVSCGAISVHR